MTSQRKAGLATGGLLQLSGENCLKCPRRNGACIEGWGKEQCDVVVCGEAPNYDDLRKGRPFSSVAGEFMYSTLKKYGYEPEDVYVTNACLCRSDDGKSPKTAEIMLCRERLIAEIKARKPKKVILLGNAALKAVMNINKIMSVRGGIMYSEELECEVYASLHPAAVFKSPSRATLFERDIKAALTDSAVRLTDLTYTVIDEHNAFNMIEHIKSFAGHTITMDIETASNGDVLCLGIGTKQKGIFVITDGALAVPEFLAIVQNVLNDSPVVGHNVKFERKMLRRNGIELNNVVYDTMLASYVLDEGIGTHGLETLARNEFNAPPYGLEADKFKKHMEDFDRDKMYEYNAYDVHYTIELLELFPKRFDAKDTHLFNTLMMPGLHVTARMEDAGVRVDREELSRLRILFTEQTNELRERAFELAGRKFNPNSPKQIMDVLYKELELPVTRLNTSADTLRELFQYHPLPEVLLEYRQSSQMLKTYITQIEEHLDEHDRLHPNYNLHTTVTGRLSCTRPNLFNIPRKYGPIIRNLFIAAEGYTLIEGDMSQAELRALAWLSGDHTLTHTMTSGADVHRQTASLIYDKPPSEISDAERQIGKRFNFAIVYRQSVKSTAEMLDCTIAEAQHVHDKVFEGMPHVRDWILEAERIGITDRQYTTPFGRKRRFGLITRENRNSVQREVVNFPVQSVAADVTLKALINLDAQVDWDTTKILLSVYDSILIETTEPDVWAVRLEEVMVNAATSLGITVPFIAELGIGQNWGNLEVI